MRTVVTFRLAWIAIAVALACSKPQAPTGEHGAAQAPDEASKDVASPAAPPAPFSPRAEIAEKGSLREAIEYARPVMSDTTNDHSAGMILLTAWAARNMTWAALQELPQTRVPLVRKDPDAHRGERLCRSGMIVQIEAVKIDEGKVFTGLLYSDGDLISFAAAKSTGDLEERSFATFCGVVTGKYDYANSGGGTGHAIDVVGMFKLPENVGIKRVRASGTVD
jgi:hypothetical protein